MTEDEKTIKAWAYDKLMNVLYNAAHSYLWNDVSFCDNEIGDFIRTFEPSHWEAILEKVKKEEPEEQDEV